MNVRMRILVLLACVFCVACSAQEPVAVEYYQPAYRTSPPEPVYSRVMWGHLPKPIKPRSETNAPLLLPVISFELPNSTLEEAIEALAQTMGYRWHYPQRIAKRRIQIRMEGTVEEVLAEIARQGKVQADFDHKQRLVRVVDGRMLPRLPGIR